MSYFFFLFCREMIRVVYAILINAIEDLRLLLGISNLLLGKITICFELLAQKKETGK